MIGDNNRVRNVLLTNKSEININSKVNKPRSLSTSTRSPPSTARDCKRVEAEKIIRAKLQACLPPQPPLRGGAERGGTVNADEQDVAKAHKRTVSEGNLLHPQRTHTLLKTTRVS